MRFPQGMRRWRLVLAVCCAIGFLPAIGRADPAVAGAVVSGPLEARVTTNPFALVITQGGKPVLRTDGGGFGFALGLRVAAQTPTAGYGLFLDPPLVRFHATKAEALGAGHYRLRTNDPLGRSFDLRIRAAAGGVLRVEAILSRPAGVLSTGAAFLRNPGERFLGFGERSEGPDKTGEVVENWAEEGPFSAGLFRPLTDPLLGEDWQGPPPFNRASNYPMPWFLSTAGYGFLLDSTWLNRFDLQGGPGWRVDTAEPTVRFDVVAGPKPLDVLERYTSLVGRQPEPAPWFFGPWYQPTGPGAETLIERGGATWASRCRVTVADVHALLAVRRAVRQSRPHPRFGRRVPRQRLQGHDVRELVRVFRTIPRAHTTPVIATDGS